MFYWHNHSKRTSCPPEMLISKLFIYFDRLLQTTSGSVVSAGGDDLEPGLMFESKKNTENATSSPLNSWGSAQINQQVFSFVGFSPPNYL